MGTRFLVETRFRGDESVAAQLAKHKLIGLGYRHRAQLKLEGGESENRFQRFEKRATDEDTLEAESERLKNAGIWAHLRSVRLI